MNFDYADEYNTKAEYFIKRYAPKFLPKFYERRDAIIDKARQANNVQIAETKRLKHPVYGALTKTQFLELMYQKS